MLAYFFHVQGLKDMKTIDSYLFSQILQPKVKIRCTDVIDGDTSLNYKPGIVGVN